MPKITFVTSAGSQTVEAPAGEDLFTTAVRAGVRTGGACGGRGSCGLCRVRVVAGIEYLPPPNATEDAHIGIAARLTHERLACQVTPTGDLTVESVGR